jgi:hypothetical protein
VKKKIVEKPPRNSAGFCGGGQGLDWAVEPRKERLYRSTTDPPHQDTEGDALSKRPILLTVMAV